MNTVQDALGTHLDRELEGVTARMMIDWFWSNIEIVWAEHCSEEIGNWAVFLPRLYDLYRVFENPEHNPYTDRSVEWSAGGVRYAHSVR
jgi:hypothetical protein